MNVVLFLRFGPRKTDSILRQSTRLPAAINGRHINCLYYYCMYRLENEHIRRAIPPIQTSDWVKTKRSQCITLRQSKHHFTRHDSRNVELTANTNPSLYFKQFHFFWGGGVVNNIACHTLTLHPRHEQSFLKRYHRSKMYLPPQK